MVPWLNELNVVQDVCYEAVLDIQEEDPNIWWRESERGDWMLFYVAGLLDSTGESVESWVMDEISEHVKCPKSSYGTAIWNCSDIPTALVLRHLAERVRAVWPDLPLVV